MSWKTLVSRGIPSCLLSLRFFTSVGHAQVPQPPANYRGPDTYGVCAWVVSDTEYFGRPFYVSSYFRIKAEQAARQYAESQAKGTPVKAACRWSYREADLATIAETDRRLAGLPGHPAHFVETNWKFEGGTIGSASQTGGNAATSSAGTTSTAGTGTVSPAQQTARSYGSRTVAGTGSSAAAASTQTAANRVAGGTAPTGTTTSAQTAASTATSGSVLGGSQQALTDAKSNAISQASGGITTATNTAVSGAMGGLNSGMQNMFKRRGSKTPTDANGSNAQAAPVQQAAAGAAPAAGGMDFTSNSGGGATPAGNTAVPVSPAEVDGVVADVSGNEVIINVGQAAGLHAGEVLVVMHVQRVVKDPVTGKPIRTVEAAVGDLRITSVDAGSSVGVFSGAGVPAVGDKVHLKP